MNEQGLQKFTPKKKANNLLKQQQITRAELGKLNKKELSVFYSELSKKFNRVKGEERDKLVVWSNDVIDESSKNELWEFNHERISWAISFLIGELGRMPSKAELAEKTGISRQTIHKHLNNFSEHPIYQDHLKQLQMLNERVLTSVYQKARNGDIGAAKLFLTATGQLKQGKETTIIDTQQNYIQINSLQLNQQNISNMPFDVLQQIEEILKGHLKQPIK